MQPRDLHRPKNACQEDGSIAKLLCFLVVSGLVLVVLRQKPAEQPAVFYERKTLTPLGGVVPGTVPLAAASPVSAAAPQQRATGDAERTLVVETPRSASQLTRAPREHEGGLPMAVLNRERARVAGAHSGQFRVYQPVPTPGLSPGGDIDDPGALDRAVAASAAESEVMLLCIGGAGSMRAGMNLIYNFRTMGLCGARLNLRSRVAPMHRSRRVVAGTTC
jgi:hypothetical protein